MSEQLRDLARPFPSSLVKSNPSGGGSYVKHSTIVQRLLQVCGPFDFEVVELIRGHVAGQAPNPQGQSRRAKEGTPSLDNAVVGCRARLAVTIDGTRVEVVEVGDCESPNNWPHDGARAKDASSDALKRCAARLGLGLHLWAGDDYYLYDRLSEGGET